MTKSQRAKRRHLSVCCVDGNLKSEIIMSNTYLQDRRLFLKGAAAATLTPWLAAGLEAQEELGEKFYIQPYLQNPTADGMTICFAALDAADVHVRWGNSKDALHESAPMNSSAMTKVTWLVWKARLANLKVGQTYYYRVDYRENGAQRSSEVYSFTPFDPQAEEVRSVIYNDVHDKIDTATELVKWVKPEDFTFSILLGDMWNDPSLASNARRAFLNLEAYVRLFDGSNKPMMFVRGNHDVRGWFSSRLSHLLDFPLNDPTAEFAEQNAYYDFRVGPMWFIAPDSGEDGSKQMALYQPYRERQAKWLAELFGDSPHREAPWRVLTTHIPLYYKGYWDAPHSRALWEATLKENKIDVSISGHIHSWGVIPKDQEIVYVDQKGKPEEQTIRHTPPFPTFIGGGPGLGEATVTFLRGNARELQLRALDTQGREVLQLALNK